MQSISVPTAQKLTATRRYDLDWLRVLAILILLFYHTGMIYVSWGFHIQSSETSPLFEDVMRWLHRWRMPLLFFISGAGTYYALRRRTTGEYASERFKRLFIPLLFGMFVIVPPQIYFEWLFRGRFSGGYADFYPNVFGFEPYQDGGKGGAFSWHHLWFILYLFLYSLLSIPVFRYLKSPAGQRLIDRLEKLVAKPGGAMTFVGLILLSQILLRPFFPDDTHALVNDWAYFVFNLLLFWFGYVLVSRPQFAQILSDQRRIFLFGTLLCTIYLYASRAYLSRHPELDDQARWEILYHLNVNCLTWFSVLTSVAYGYRYLNVNRPILPHLTEAVYPFYILHQTVIIVIGYYVLKSGQFGIYGGFGLISLSTLAICVLVYWFLIRPFKLTRLLFGLK
ncbi:acyltransferase-like protein [Larkinella arboricola]|uniref:Acyltransferase-like protein n=1 Tax=Larkinella arboricola TaxID=643671 RepID=A0A327WT39_LARAB|nr:acyltransferase family protein [Larkinella arboricola]RAJ95663.1 acyltransferase-like protein [Larkinella arboricola]